MIFTIKEVNKKPAGVEYIVTTPLMNGDIATTSLIVPTSISIGALADIETYIKTELSSRFSVNQAPAYKLMTPETTITVN